MSRRHRPLVGLVLVTMGAFAAFLSSGDHGESALVAVVVAGAFGALIGCTALAVWGWFFAGRCRTETSSESGRAT